MTLGQLIKLIEKAANAADILGKGIEGFKKLIHMLKDFGVRTGQLIREMIAVPDREAIGTKITWIFRDVDDIGKRVL